VDVPLVIKHRLKELGLEQRGLAMAAQVTESYISQLLARKKLPPAPNRSDIYDKMESFLRLPSGELSKLANLQRKEALKKRIADPPQPLFKEFRALILRKCVRAKHAHVRAIFEKEPFGEIERLVTQKLLDVAKGIAKEELEDVKWLHLVAQLSKRSYQQTRVQILEFLDADVFSVSVENCLFFLEPLIESWDMDIQTLGVELVLNRKLTDGHFKRFGFVELEPEPLFDVEPALDEFLQDRTLSGDATNEEIEFLKALRFKDRRPSPLYYYRELQSLRDPLHFRPSGQGK
jgi:transcriptional regulator with XRE-family HTH domain